MVNIEKMYEELSPHMKEYIENRKKRIETGFNLFYLISDYYYRETFHGDIIAALLDPKEKHNKGITYLSLFINLINSKKQLVEKKYYESESTRVIKEQHTDDGILKGRIDIFIEGTDKHCIVIENKLNNAGDTNRQLPKYYKDLKEKEGYNIDAFVYLPLDPNKEPNKSEWSPEEIEYIDKHLVIIPAYTSEGINLVKDWLTPAENDSINDAKFIIKQYKTLLNNLTIDIMDNKDIIEVLSKDENNIETTLNILENGEAFFNKMVDLFIQGLGNMAQKKGYMFSHNSNNRIEIRNDRWIYFIEKYSKNGSYCRGIERNDINNTNVNKENFFGGDTSRCNSKFPLGWDYFNGERQNWSLPSTIREMCNGSFADDIIKEVQSAFKEMAKL